MFTVQIILEKDEDSGFVARCPAFPGCVSQGETEDEAATNLLDALDLWLKTQQSRTLQEWQSNNEVNIAGQRELKFSTVCSQ